jgi:hypothetical protein
MDNMFVDRLYALSKTEAKHNDMSIIIEVVNRITELENLLFVLGAMEHAPCFCCGYNGPGYFNSNIHSCAERHHRLYKSE